MARKKIDLTGQRFGRLVVLYDTGERKNRQVVWHCKCDCGKEVNVISGHLVSCHTTSCGCYQRERTAEAHTTHGMRRREETHPVYRTWRNMIQRCEYPSDKRYKDYGGRGITVCDEWHDSRVFVDWALASGWQEGLSIDRINNDGNYEPSNCRWVTQKEQQRNKRNNHLIIFNGKTQTLAAWSDETGIPYDTLRARVNSYHWPIERALSI